MVANVLTGDPGNIEEAKRILAEASPLHGRPGLAEDVANAALWLASDESGYTTGHTLTTDAGITVGATAAQAGQCRVASQFNKNGSEKVPEFTMETLLEQARIENVLKRYATALDSRDWAGLDDVFIEDATAHFQSMGHFNGRWEMLN